MFKNLPRQTFGKVQSKLFPQYFSLTAGANLLALGTLSRALERCTVAPLHRTAPRARRRPPQSHTQLPALAMARRKCSHWKKASGKIYYCSKGPNGKPADALPHSKLCAAPDAPVPVRHRIAHDGGGGRHARWHQGPGGARREPGWPAGGCGGKHNGLQQLLLHVESACEGCVGQGTERGVCRPA
jgi:hypothetical protein